MQGVFDFCEDLPVRPKRPERLFFGLFPDTETSVRAGRCGARFLSEDRQEWTWLKTERRHVSLHHVGDYKRLRTKFIYAARQAALAVSMRPFEVIFRFIKSVEVAPPIGGRPGRRALVLLCEGDGLGDLDRILGAAMQIFSNRIIAAMGNGLIATPAASPRTEPITSPTCALAGRYSSSSCRARCTASRRPAAGSLR